MPGFAVVFNDNNPAEFVLTITAATPQAASVFASILQGITYSNPVTDFSFNPQDRTPAFTLTDEAGGTTSGQLSSPVAIVDMAANVSDTDDSHEFTGANLADTILGFGGDDDLKGGDGNDTLDGGAGDDTINGGSGDDLIKQSIDEGSDDIDGGSNTAIGDTLRVDADVASGATLEIEASGAQATIGDPLTGIATFKNIEHVEVLGGDAGDSFTAVNSLAGTSVATLRLSTGGGDDTIDLSALTGVEVYIDAGTGDDMIVLGTTADTIRFSFDFGNDLVTNFTTGADKPNSIPPPMGRSTSRSPGRGPTNTNSRSPTRATSSSARSRCRRPAGPSRTRTI